MKTRIRAWSVLILPFAAFTPIEATSQGAETRSAQSSSSELDEIIVTTRRRDERLIEVPVSITVLEANAIEREGITSVEDVANLTPGLTFDRGRIANDFKPAIRGLQAERGRNSVGILIDDIDTTSENLQGPGGGALARQRLMDIQRIEVVKGPHPALYGRSAFGGALNYISRRPSREDVSVRASLESTSQQDFSGQLSVSGPISEGLAVGLNGYAFDSRGAYRNLRSGSYVGESSGLGVAGSFVGEPTEKVTVYGRVEYNNDEYGPIAGFVSPGTTISPVPANASTVTTATTARLFTGPVKQLPSEFDVNPRTGKDYAGFETKNFRGSLIADWDLGNVGLKSLTSYLTSQYDLRQDNDYVTGILPNGDMRAGVVSQETNRDANTRQVSQELRLFSQGEGRVQWLVGGLLWKETIDQGGNDNAALALNQLTPADVLFFLTSREGQSRNFSRDTEHRSLFAWGEYEFGNSIFLALEGRYSKETIDYGAVFNNYSFFDGVTNRSRATGTSTPPVITSLGIVPGSFSDSIEESYFTPKATLSYRPTPTLNIYGSVSEAIKPAGHNTGDTTTIDATTLYDRENLLAYEIGFKTRFPTQQLSLNGAFFYQDYKDQQVSSLVINPMFNLLQGVIENAGRSTIMGAEFDLNWSITPALSIRAAYTYIDASFDSFRVFSNNATLLAQSGCNRVVVQAPGTPPTCEVSRDGNSPALTPEHQTYANATYVVPVSSTFEATLQVDHRYTSKRFVDSNNRGFFEGYSRVGLQAGLSNERFRAILYVENLFDDETVTTGGVSSDFRVTGFPNAAFGIQPDPRTYGIRLNYSL